ncbi:MAG: RNA polymerase sigma factor [Candidatus Dormibacteraceae bacterium]
MGDTVSPAATPGSAAESWLDPVSQFPLLYEREYPSVFRTVRAIVLDQSDAEDLTQDCFARAYRARQRYKPDAPPTAWLHRIAVNTAISHLRRRKLAKFLPLKVEQSADDRELGRVETRSLIELALADLSPKLRAAVVLQYYEDRPREEIAEILGVPVGTVASRLANAMAQMRARVAELEHSGIATGSDGQGRQ